MEATLHRFIRLLRLAGVRVSIPEALDAMRCAAEPGVLSSRTVLRTALRVALVKDHRDEAVFDEIFDAFFSLVRVGPDDHGHGHSHARDDLADTGDVESFTLSEEPSETPQPGHEHGKPASIRDYFKQEDLAQRYNLHQEANKIDLAALTDEIAFSKDSRTGDDESYRMQLSTERLRGAGTAGSLATASGTPVDAELSIAEQEVLLGWLDGQLDDAAGDETDAAAVRARLAGVLENLPQALKRHLEALLALETRIVETTERRKFVKHQQQSVAVRSFVQVFGQAAAQLVENEPDERLGAADVGRRHDEIECDGARRIDEIGDPPVALPRDFRDHRIAVEAEEGHGG